MELPQKLKILYRHWDKHVVAERKNLRASTLCEDKVFFENLSTFIHERMRIWEQKVSGKTPPYTTDPILSRYRFCNIFREFDRQTIEFHTMLNPYRDNFPLWLLNMFYCRMVARPETIRHTGLLSFSKEDNEVLYTRLIDSPRPRFGTPYVFPISTILRGETPTRELFIRDHLPKHMHVIAEEIRTWNKESICAGVEKIIPRFGHNLIFLWTEVLIDIAYQFPEHIDLFDRFPIGPGSKTTLQKINAAKDPSVLVKDLANSSFDVGLTYNGSPVRLSAENWEGICCEFRKYTNLKNGHGRRRIFRA